jgi:hypothetical protein
MCAQILATGAITVNAANFPGSQVAFTVNYAGFNALNALASWATSTTKILSSELIRIQRSFQAASGKEPGQAVMNAGVTGSMIANTEIADFAQFALGPSIISGGPITTGMALPALRVGGLAWKQADGVFVPVNGAATRYFADDKVAFLPSDLRDSLGLAEGYGYVPVGMDRVAKAPQRGAYAYAAVNPDVPTVRLYAGWVGLPVLIAPQDLTVFTTTP